jgi:hypothetical protein
MESDEEKAADSYEYGEMTDAEVKRYYLIYGENPPMNQRYQVVADCPLIEWEKVSEPHLPRYQAAWERMVRNINKNHYTRKMWWQMRGWLGHENERLRAGAYFSGSWRNMYLTAPPINKMVVSFEWNGSNPAGVSKRVERSRVVTSSTGLTCEHVFTVFLDTEGQLEVYTQDPAVETKLLSYAGLSFDPGVEIEDFTPRSFLDELAAAGFKMRPDLGRLGFAMIIAGIVIATPAELTAMQQPIEVVKEEYETLCRHQEFMFAAPEMHADGEDFEDDHYVESLPVGMRFSEETVAWEERVEQAHIWRARALRRWKK